MTRQALNRNFNLFVKLTCGFLHYYLAWRWCKSVSS